MSDNMKMDSRPALERVLAARESGDTKQCIDLCRQAMAFLNEEVETEEWCKVRYELANTLQKQDDTSRQDENVEEVVALLESILRHPHFESRPQSLAFLKADLAKAYSLRKLGNRSDNLERSIRFYKEAQDVFVKETFPELWAKLQVKLVGVYKERVWGQRADNLELAIQHCMDALPILTRTRLLREWAVLQWSLWSSYRERIYGDASENLDLAIKHFRNALKFFTRSRFPEDWAVIHDGLGISYCERIRGTRSKNLQQAIHHWSLALEVFTNKEFPKDRVRVRRRLASASKKLANL